MHKYQNNAFRVLGLLPSASMQEIMSRVSEIKVKSSLGFDIKYDYDFPWMGSLDRSDENILNALQRLEDPIARLKEEIFWFWIESDEDKKALNHLIENKRQAAHAIWAMDTYKPAEESMRGSINQAILAHSSVISKEINLKYQEDLREQKILVQEESEIYCCPDCQKIYDKEWKICIKCSVALVVQKNERKEKLIKSRASSAVLNESHWKNWRFAVSKFLLLNTSDIFWEKIRCRIKLINDPRLPHSKVEELKDSFLIEVIEPNLEFISRALASKDYERAKLHSNLLNGFSLPSSVLKDCLNKILSNHIDLLNDYSEAATKEISKFKDDVAKTTVIEVYSKFAQQIKDVIYEGNLVDISSISDFALARDNAAGVLRSLSVQVYNNCNDFKKSFEIITEAVECAASSYLKQRLQKDLEVVRLRLIASERTQQPLKQSKLGKINWWDGVKKYWWIGILCFWFFSSLFSNSSSQNSSSSSSSSQSAISISALKAQIESAKARLKIKENQLTELDAQLEQKKDELLAIQKYTDDVVAQYNNATIPPEVEQKYNSLIDDYNNVKHPAFKNLIEQRENLYSAYEAELKKANKLVDSYNKRIR